MEQYSFRSFEWWSLSVEVEPTKAGKYKKVWFVVNWARSTVTETILPSDATCANCTMKESIFQCAPFLVDQHKFDWVPGVIKMHNTSSFPLLDLSHTSYSNAVCPVYTSGMTDKEIVLIDSLNDAWLCEAAQVVVSASVIGTILSLQSEVNNLYAGS